MLFYACFCFKMNGVSQRQRAYDSREYDIADRIYVNILFFEKAYSLSKSTLFANFFITLYLPLGSYVCHFTTFLYSLPPANSGYTKFMVYLSFYRNHP